MQCPLNKQKKNRIYSSTIHIGIRIIVVAVKKRRGRCECTTNVREYKRVKRHCIAFRLKSVGAN